MHPWYIVGLVPGHLNKVSYTLFAGKGSSFLLVKGLPHFVKSRGEGVTSVKHNKAKCNETRHAYINLIFTVTYKLGVGT